MTTSPTRSVSLTEDQWRAVSNALELAAFVQSSRGCEEIAGETCVLIDLLQPKPRTVLEQVNSLLRTHRYQIIGSNVQDGVMRITWVSVDDVIEVVAYEGEITTVTRYGAVERVKTAGSNALAAVTDWLTQ